jgi:hypothetical protein
VIEVATLVITGAGRKAIGQDEPIAKRHNFDY